jgi:superoxide dismutase, Fe-Mn family
MTHVLEPLPYAYNALEPYIDEQTMKFHHDKHHQTYVDKLNAALSENPDLQKKKVEELLKDINKIPEKIRTPVKNHGGGVANHNFFWLVLKKDVKPRGDVVTAITKQWGSLDKFKEEFTAAALNRFGSGWAWLVISKGKLEIMSTANQDSPLSDGKTPILTIDVWEHAYYLKYQNRRNEYVANFWNVVNWDKVNELYTKAK